MWLLLALRAKDANALEIKSFPVNPGSLSQARKGSPALLRSALAGEKTRVPRLVDQVGHECCVRADHKERVRLVHCWRRSSFEKCVPNALLVAGEAID